MNLLKKIVLLALAGFLNIFFSTEITAQNDEKISLQVANILTNQVMDSTKLLTDSISNTAASFDVMPIVSYDTDVGIGYGAKAFFLNPLSLKESFDVTAFNSTLGERWYKFVFSYPDFEIRHAKEFTIAIDFIVDYDKYIKNNFFGIGSESSFADREYYTKTPLEISLNLSHGFKRNLVGQVGIKFRSVENSNFVQESKFFALNNSLSRSTVKYLALTLSTRYDSRDSYINPRNGTVMQLSSEIAPEMGNSFSKYFDLKFLFQQYYSILNPRMTFAFRFGVQSVFGNDLPVQLLAPLGGDRTIRGLNQDRFINSAISLATIELRFLIYYRLGAVFGLDAGKILDNLSQFSLNGWKSSPVAGLRYYFDTFIVRADLGFSSETTGFFLNFGHVF